MRATRQWRVRTDVLSAGRTVCFSQGTRALGTNAFLSLLFQFLQTQRSHLWYFSFPFFDALRLVPGSNWFLRCLVTSYIPGKSLHHVFLDWESTFSPYFTPTRKNLTSDFESNFCYQIYTEGHSCMIYVQVIFKWLILTKRSGFNDIRTPLVLTFVSSAS